MAKSKKRSPSGLMSEAAKKTGRAVSQTAKRVSRQEAFAAGQSSRQPVRGCEESVARCEGHGAKGRRQAPDSRSEIARPIAAKVSSAGSLRIPPLLPKLSAHILDQQS